MSYTDYSCVCRRFHVGPLDGMRNIYHLLEDRVVPQQQEDHSKAATATTVITGKRLGTD